MTTLADRVAPDAAQVDHQPWALRVHGLSKLYGDQDPVAVADTGPEHQTAVSAATGAVVACWDVGFEVAPGEALGLIGESGSGKSTVLRCLAGDERASAGSAYLRSVEEGRKDILSASDTERRRYRVDQLSVVYQSPADGLDLRLTAGGNVIAPLVQAGWRGFGAMRQRAALLLDRTEVSRSRMDHVVDTFSGGMQQRVQIARALANEPPVLLLDEPTTGLDASVAAGVLDLLRGLLEELGLAAVVVSHDFAVIEMLTRRVLVMQHGRVVESGLTDQLLEDPQHPYSQRLVAAARG